MGCSSSLGELTKFKVNESISGQGQQTVVIAESLGITKKELNKLFRSFVSFDEIRLKTGRKQQGKQHIEEFFEHITTKEIAHHLAISFYSKSGDITFEEFVVTSWWIVSLNEEEVAKWIFRLFDSDHDDKMTPEEMKHLVETIGSHNTNAMKGLDDCYKHLCFEKVEQQPQKPKGPLYYGKPMDSQVPWDDTPKYIMQEKLYVKLVDWTSHISKKPSVLKPIFEMQAMLREKTAGSRFFRWREYRQKTFGSNLTLDEIIERLGTQTTYKLQLKPPAKVNGKGISRGNTVVTTTTVVSGKGSDKSAEHGNQLESAVVEEPMHVNKLHVFHAEKRPSIVSVADSDTHSNHHHSLKHSRKDKNHHPTTASAAQSGRNNSHKSNTPQTTPRDNQEKTHHPTTASAAQSGRNNSQKNNNNALTPRSSKDNKSHHPTTASAANSARNSAKNTPQHTPRSSRATFPALADKENLYRDVIAILEQNSNLQAHTPSKGTFNLQSFLILPNTS